MRKWCDDLTRGDHVVHIYRSDDEQAKGLLDLVGWMREEEKLALLCDGGEAGDPCSLGGHVFEAAVQEGRLEVLPSYRKMCPAGRFHAEAVANLIMTEYGRALDDGFGSLVLCIDLSWMAGTPEDFTAHVVQLSQITMSKLPSNLTLLCQYDRRRLTPEQAEGVQRVHQLSLVDGELVRNFWVVATSALGGMARSIRAVRVPGTAAAPEPEK